MPDFATYKATHRFANLDGLRFVAIVLVMFHHVLPEHQATGALWQRGFLGVDLFFVLSGFLITTLLLREADANGGSFSLRKFYQRRVLRILPAYYLLITAVSLYYVVGKERADLAELVPYYYLFLSNFLTEHLPTLDPTWSVSVEEQFYMIWPLLLLLIPKRNVVSFLLVLIFINVAGARGAFGSDPAHLGPLVLRLPNPTYAPLLLGALLAMHLHTQRGFELLARVLGGRWTSLSLATALVVCVALAPLDLRGLPNLAIHLLMTGLLASLVIRENGFGARVLQTPMIARVGVVSYGIYLYHLVVLDVVGRLFDKLGVSSIALTFVVYGILSWIVAEISFRTFETFFQRFRPRTKYT